MALLAACGGSDSNSGATTDTPDDTTYATTDTVDDALRLLGELPQRDAGVVPQVPDEAPDVDQVGGLTDASAGRQFHCRGLALAACTGHQPCSQRGDSVVQIAGSGNV